MDYTSQLDKIYTNENGVEKFGLIYSSIQSTPKNNGFISTLEITNKITITSDWFIEKEQAEKDCVKKAVLVIRNIEYNIQNSYKTKIIQKFYKYKQWSKELKLELGFWLYKKLFTNRKSIIVKLLSIILIVLVYKYPMIYIPIILVLVSPLWFYKKGYRLGKSSGNRCIIRKTANLENIFQEKTDYLYADDKFLILDQAISNIGDDNSFFEVVLTKNVVLYNVNQNQQYPTYCLPKLMGVGVRIIGEIGSGGEYSIVFLSYERDGLPKRYISRNVSSNAFTTVNINFNKYNVFSKYGFHVHKERYISIIQTSSFINWYLGVLSIYKDYIITFLIDLFTDSYKEVDKIVGFDKFQLITDQTISEFLK